MRDVPVAPATPLLPSLRPTGDFGKRVLQVCRRSAQHRWHQVTLHHGGAIRSAVHALKYRNLRAAAPTLGRLMAGWVESNPISGQALVPVPLHRRRLRERGYNQSELLAREVAKERALPVLDGILVRTRDTPPQVSLSYDDRVKNVEGSFECRADVSGRSLILVDDVVTTGSTLFACAAALKAGGAVAVWGLALAREGPGL